MERTQLVAPSGLSGDAAIAGDLGGGRTRAIVSRAPFRHEHHSGRDELQAAERHPGEHLAGNRPVSGEMVLSPMP